MHGSSGDEKVSWNIHVCRDAVGSTKRSGFSRKYMRVNAMELWVNLQPLLYGKIFKVKARQYLPCSHGITKASESLAGCQLMSPLQPACFRNEREMAGKSHSGLIDTFPEAYCFTRVNKFILKKVVHTHVPRLLLAFKLSSKVQVHRQGTIYYTTTPVREYMSGQTV